MANKAKASKSISVILIKTYPTLSKGSSGKRTVEFSQISKSRGRDTLAVHLLRKTCLVLLTNELAATFPNPVGKEAFESFEVKYRGLVADRLPGRSEKTQSAYQSLGRNQIISSRNVSSGKRCEEFTSITQPKKKPITVDQGAA
jgi:hypothetical protein